MAYHGPGLAMETLSAAGKRGDAALSPLEEENAQLREDVTYLQQLLSVWQPQPCSICQLHAASSNTSTGRPSTNQQPAARDASSTHAAIDKLIRRQGVLIAQQQRQLQMLQLELSSREQVLLEADAVLAETHRRITALAAWATNQQASQVTAVVQQQQQQQQQRMAAPPGTAGSRRLVPTTRPGTSSSLSSVGAASVSAAAAAAAARAGSGAAAASSVQQVYGVVLEQCKSLLAWCRESEARMARFKAASAAQCRAPPAAAGSSHHSSFTSKRAASSSGGGSSKQPWQSPDKAAPAAPGDVQQALQLPYLPAGGNSFLQPGANLTLAGIASGQGLSALAAAALPQLLQQLAGLAAPLAALAVQLRSSILPALPWLQAGQLGPELTTSCALLAQQAATTAVKLSELCALLPAAPATLSAPAAAAARMARAGQAASVAEAGAWGCPRSKQHPGRQQQQAGLPAAEAASDTTAYSDTASAGDGVELDSEDAALLGQLASLLLQPRGPQAQPGQQHKGLQHTAMKQQAAAATLERLQQRLHVLSLKQRVLNEQLAFLAQCSAAAAKLMTQLSADVLQALAAAIDAAEPPSLQQQRSRALQLCAQLQRASALAQQQSSAASSCAGDSLQGSAAMLPRSSSRSGRGSGSSTARTVLALLDSNRDVLDGMPKLLSAASSASALKAAATAAVVAALNEFRKGLQPYMSCYD